MKNLKNGVVLRTDFIQFYEVTREFEYDKNPLYSYSPPSYT